MRIAIVGAGALGCLFGGFLSNSGQDVLLLDHNPEKVRLININGLLIEEPDGTISATVTAVSNAGGLPPADLVIILVKTTSTARALADCAPLVGADTILMTLQNGYGNAEDLMAVVPPDRIIVGTTSQGSALLGPGHIRHSGCGETYIGACGSLPDSRLATVAGLFSAAGIATTVAGDVTRLVWQKLFINVGINALTALLDVANGELLHSGETRDLVRDLVFEAVAVAGAKGYLFEKNAVLDNVFAVAEKTAANISSMLQDIRRGRPTEIRRMNGAIADMGQVLGIPAPCNHLITRLVLGRECLAAKSQRTDQP